VNPLTGKVEVAHTQARIPNAVFAAAFFAFVLAAGSAPHVQATLEPVSSTPTPSSPAPMTPPANSTQSVSVFVPVTLPWTDTRVDVPSGAEIAITGPGTAQFAAWNTQQGPDGNPACPYVSTPLVAPGLSCWSLIGRIGSGAPFLVGSATSLFAPNSGRLYLGANDELAYFYDNAGGWTARVTVMPQSSGLSSPQNKMFSGSIQVVK